MPAKKSNKSAKKPVKSAPKKAVAKAAAPRKGSRAPAKAPVKPLSSKVNVKPKKSASKSTPAKPVESKPRPKAAAAAAPAAKVESAKVVKSKPAAQTAAAPVKFDVRPLVTNRSFAGDEDAEGESQPSSLLAGPRNVKPYIPRRGEQYMNKEQLEHFARILQNWKRDLMVEVDRTVLHMKDEAANFPDPNDRATQEEEFSLELRTRDRERKLIRKIDEALKRIEDGTYGYCLETGEEIGIKRLEARPVATLSVEAQERRERREKQYGDRDDRYR
ncbi:MAG: RNA polymerase-binding protein DksA [Gammaproteobacteria bacterium]|nr:RNA polymerase-binding protein DksA [Gammaproteobacteria bacterium]